MRICHQIFDYGLQEHSKRQDEVTQFWECVEEAKSENKAMGMKTIEEFIADKKRVGDTMLYLLKTLNQLNNST